MVCENKLINFVFSLKADNNLCIICIEIYIHTVKLINYNG